MSRVIKVRVWDAHHKVIVRVGDTMPDGYVIDQILAGWNRAAAPEYQLTWSVVCAKRRFTPYGLCPSFSDYRESVLEQWTGLLDKAGTEIYEGDILLDRREQFAAKWDDYSEVVWEANGWRLRDSKQNTHGWIGGHWTANSVVAGNVHQHPDLLKP